MKKESIGFQEYFEKKTLRYKKDKLNEKIKNVRIKIQKHLNGERNKELEKEIEYKMRCNLNTSSTTERYMNLILKIDEFAESIYRDNVKTTVPKAKILEEYFKYKNLNNIETVLNEGKESTFGEHKKILYFNVLKRNIYPVLFTNSAGANEVKGKFDRLLTNIKRNKLSYVIYSEIDTCERVVNKNYKNLKGIRFLPIDKFIEHCQKLI